MKEKIIQYLKEIEKKNNIEILLACETGSRAWGFPSPDSDYDVRLIYKHKKEWYLSLSEEKDTIEQMLDDNEIDICGWDVRKSLRLLWKSNPPLLERIQSPIVYICNEDFLSGINDVSKDVYSRIATIHHYLSMSKNCLVEIENKDNYKLKKLFYALRAAIACKWIIDRTEIPPIFFPTMLDGLDIEQNLKNRILELIKIKSKMDESYFHSGENEIIELIKNIIEIAESNAKFLPSGNGNFEKLNSFFQNTLENSYDN